MAFANRFDSTPDEIDDYVRSLLELIGDRDPLDVLCGTPAQLDGLLRPLGEAALRQPEREGKWSIAQVVAHLADADLVVGFRYRMTVGQDRPPLQGYDQDAWAIRMRYAEVPIEESLDLFRAVRRANVRLLRSLTDDERERAGLHAERGPETVARLAQLNAGHDLVHLRQIERIATAVT